MSAADLLVLLWLQLEDVSIILLGLIVHTVEWEDAEEEEEEEGWE